MSAMLGVGLLTAAALLFAWSYGQFLRPQPKAWTRSDLAAVSITLTTVSLLAFSLACLGTFFGNISAETRWLETIAAAGGALLLSWILIPRLMAPALRPANANAALRTVMNSVPEPANDPHSTPPARPGPSAGKPNRHRAA